jgi:small subunit ribosomal protein S6
MPFYEHVILARQDLSPQQVEELTTQLSGVIAQMGGKVSKHEYWGLKSLSYRIKKNRKAHLALLNIDAPATAVNEIERQERLSEDVLRYLTIRVDTLEDGPSSMMRKADRDERRGERRGRRDELGDDIDMVTEE